jgi:hypothetical protein
MYAYSPGLADVDGLGSKLKKVVKKVEQKLRPVAKVAAVVGTAMYAPQMLPAAVSLVSKPKDEPLPVEPLPAPAQILPATATPAVPGLAPAPAPAAAPPLPQMLPQMFAPAAPQPLQPMFVPAPAQGSGWDTKTMLVWGGLGLGAVGLLALALRR